MKRDAKPYTNPYLAGILLGLVLFVSNILFGHGLGASGGVAKVVGVVEHAVVPAHTDQSAYLTELVRTGGNPLDTWLVIEIAGVILGGFLSGLLAGRVRVETFRGPRLSDRQRWLLAFVGGAIAGFGVRMARGCTSSQALSGGAVLSAGSWAFMFAVFGGAYLMAWFVRKTWN